MLDIMLNIFGFGFFSFCLSRRPVRGMLFVGVRRAGQCWAWVRSSGCSLGPRALHSCYWDIHTHDSLEGTVTPPQHTGGWVTSHLCSRLVSGLIINHLGDTLRVYSMYSQCGDIFRRLFWLKTTFK